MPLPTPTLLTARLRLRPITDADAGVLLALHGDAHVLRYWDSPPWTDGARAQRFVAACRELAAEGTTIMVSTHLLAEVEQLCSHVGVMSGGRMVAQGTLDGVTAGTATRVRVECREPGLAAQVLTRAGLAAVTTTDDGASAELRAAGSASGAVEVDAERVLAALVAAGAGVSQFGTQRSTLEDLFVSLTGEGFDVRA